MGRRVLKFDGLSGRGLWWRLRRKFYKAAFGTYPPVPILHKAGHRGRINLSTLSCRVMWPIVQHP